MELGIFETREFRQAVGAVAVAGITFLVLVLARALVQRAAARAATGAPRTSLRSMPGRLAASARVPLAMVVAAYAGSLVLDLPPEVTRAARATAVIAVLLQFALWGGDLISFWADRYQARAVEHGSAAAGVATAFALRFLASLVLWVVLVLLALENVGVEITTLIAGLGIGGIAVALAAQSVLGDFFASLAIVLDRPFVVGDFIQVGDLRGTVERVGVKTTRVRSIDGEQLVFSNADLVRSRIQNYGRLQERRGVVRFRLDPSATAGQVERARSIVREVVDTQPLARLERAHFLGFLDGAWELEAVYFVESPRYLVHMDIQEAIHLEVMRRFAEAGIGFAGVPKPEPAPAGSPAVGDEV